VLKSLAVKALTSNLQLVFEIAPNVPDFVVGDPFRMRQVITNLVGGLFIHLPNSTILILTNNIQDWECNQVHF
jgi:hypothetical protein